MVGSRGRRSTISIITGNNNCKENYQHAARRLKAASSKLVVFFCSSELKPISSLSYSDQMPRLRRIRLELVAQASDVLIDGA
jgi:hypothetical protein